MGNLHQQPARGLSAPSSAGREPPNVWRSIFYPAELVKQRERWEKICEVTATAATGWKRCFLMKMSDIARCGALCSVFSEEEKWATAEGFRFTSGSNYRSKSRSLEWIHNREVRLKGISGLNWRVIIVILMLLMFPAWWRIWQHKILLTRVFCMRSHERKPLEFFLHQRVVLAFMNPRKNHSTLQAEARCTVLD